jgi:hypothetical protein
MSNVTSGIAAANKKAELEHKAALEAHAEKQRLIDAGMLSNLDLVGQRNDLDVQGALIDPIEFPSGPTRKKGAKSPGTGGSPKSTVYCRKCRTRHLSHKRCGRKVRRKCLAHGLKACKTCVRTRGRPTSADPVDRRPYYAAIYPQHHEFLKRSEMQGVGPAHILDMLLLHPRFKKEGAKIWAGAHQQFREADREREDGQVGAPMNYGASSGVQHDVYLRRSAAKSLAGYGIDMDRGWRKNKRSVSLTDALNMACDLCLLESLVLGMDNVRKIGVTPDQLEAVKNSVASRVW